MRWKVVVVEVLVMIYRGMNNLSTIKKQRIVGITVKDYNDNILSIAAAAFFDDCSRCNDKYFLSVPVSL